MNASTITSAFDSSFTGDFAGTKEGGHPFHPARRRQYGRPGEAASKNAADDKTAALMALLQQSIDASG